MGKDSSSETAVEKSDSIYCLNEFFWVVQQYWPGQLKGMLHELSQNGGSARAGLLCTKSLQQPKFLTDKIIEDLELVLTG